MKTIIISIISCFFFLSINNLHAQSCCNKLNAKPVKSMNTTRADFNKKEQHRGPQNLKRVHSMDKCKKVDAKSSRHQADREKMKAHKKRKRK